MPVVNPQPPTSEDFILRRLSITASAQSPRIGSQIFNSAELSAIDADLVTRDIVFKLDSFLFAQRLAGEQITRHQDVTWSPPDGRWQRFKLRHTRAWWLGWLVSWRPVRRLEFKRTVVLIVEYDDYATFPSNTKNFPIELGPPIYQRIISDVRLASKTNTSIN